MWFDVRPVTRGLEIFLYNNRQVSWLTVQRAVPPSRSLSGIIMDCTPCSQWRVRTGFSPVSLFTGSSLPKNMAYLIRHLLFLYSTVTHYNAFISRKQHKINWTEISTFQSDIKLFLYFIHSPCFSQPIVLLLIQNLFSLCSDVRGRLSGIFRTGVHGLGNRTFPF